MKNECLVCHSHNLETLCYMISGYVKYLFKKVAICEECGHIQLDPIFDEDTYEKINTRFFSNQYVNIGSMERVIERKLQRLDSKMVDIAKPNMKVLDIGAGEGWALDYFKEKECTYYAIEAVEELATSIEKRGGKIIGQTFLEDYSRHERKYDIIIFRHILEHMLNPLAALKKLKSMLSENGFIYLALPNAESAALKHGFRSWYIRPVHISYFCKQNVLRLVEQADLKPLSTDVTREVVCVLTHGTNSGDEQTSLHPNMYREQKKYFKMMKRKALLKDAVGLIKVLMGRSLI